MGEEQKKWHPRGIVDANSPVKFALADRVCRARSVTEDQSLTVRPLCLAPVAAPVEGAPALAVAPHVPDPAAV